MMDFVAHSIPKIWINFLKFNVAASRTENTGSPNQDRHNAESFSSKNSTPNWLASNGMYSMMARRTRQSLSSASSTIAGNSGCDNTSTPMILFTASSFEMIFRRTSGISSLSRRKKRSSKSLIAASFSKSGASPNTTEASEAIVNQANARRVSTKHG
jgi:hypothetical protein